MSQMHHVSKLAQNLWKVMGFRELALQLIAMAAKYGNMPVDEVLPSARTVSRHLATVAEAQKRNLKSKLSDIK